MYKGVIMAKIKGREGKRLDSKKYDVAGEKVRLYCKGPNCSRQRIDAKVVDINAWFKKIKDAKDSVSDAKLKLHCEGPDCSKKSVDIKVSDVKNLFKKAKTSAKVA